MKSTKNITSILNTLSYISLLPKEEQAIELCRMTQNIKSINTIN